MPWWSWVLIWVGLALLLLGVLAACGWMLFKKTMTAFHALGELADKTERLGAASDELREERFVPSVLKPRAEVSEAYSSLQQVRQTRKDDRHEARLARGRLLTSADATRRVINDAR